MFTPYPKCLVLDTISSPDGPAEQLLNLQSFFCSNALIALARSLCKCLLAQLITASGANAVKGYFVRCACIDGIAKFAKHPRNSILFSAGLQQNTT